MTKIKVIKNQKDYEEALELLTVLMDKNPEPESEEGDQLNLLSTLIEDYESKSFPQTLPDPIEAIKFRMEQEDLKPADLIPYIGSRSRVSEILSGKRTLTLDMIRNLETGLGIPAKVLVKKPAMNEKSQYQNWSDRLVKEMSNRGYFGKKMFDGQNKESLLSIFFQNDNSLAPQIAWRKTSTRTSAFTDQQALMSWYRYAQSKADKIKVPLRYKNGTINPDFMKAVAKLSIEKEGPIIARECLLKHGIVLVIAKHLPKTKVDGIAILTDKTKPVIGLSLRFDRLDNFWFTLMHELAHVSLHLDKKQDAEIFFDELEDAKGIEISPQEKEADFFAQEALIPQSKWEISPAKMVPSPMAAQSLANELGINIAVVAGIIRHKHQNYYYLNKIVNDENAKVRKFFPDEF